MASLIGILRESSGEPSGADIDRLERAWAGDRTFAFLPEKSSVTDEWVRTALDSLPANLTTRHFALLTSGSTGHPKLVVGSRARAETLARVLHEVQGSEPVRDTVLTLPLSYCYAFVNQWLWARTFNRRLVATRGFGAPDELRTALNDVRDAMVCLVGAQLPLFARYFPDVVFPGVIRVHFAGGPFPEHERERLARLFPHAEVFNNYGCAEAMPRLTVRRSTDGVSATDIGCPIPGVTLSRSADGELLFHSAYAAVAFVDDAGVQLLDDDSWIPTGDFGAEGPAGHWELAGRANQVFKRYGEKIALGLLRETAMTHWSGDAEFYREADHLNEPGFVLVLAPVPREEDVRAILKAFRARHPRTHWPLRVESVERLPALPNGKTDLAALSTLACTTVHWRSRI